jgi:cytochrome c peroxidase
MALPGGPILVSAGAPINFDATRQGTAFRDGDGDAITYEVQLLSPDLGLTIQGTQVIGTLPTVGVVHFKLIARDQYGGQGELTFSFAVAAPEPGRPLLPVVSYVYDDAVLPLPPHFKNPSNPIGDTDPPPPFNNVSNAGATLGRALFYDKRLSITNTHSCASCHIQRHGFATPDRFPTGVTNVPLKRNAMGLTNVRYNFRNRYFGDERVETLEKLATMPIEDPNELGNSFPHLETKLANTDFYPALFAAAFGSPEVTHDRIARALAQFLRSIISYQTMFDAVGGDFWDPRMTEQERLGAQIFDLSRCDGCHSTSVQTMLQARNNGLDAVPTDPGAGDGRFRAASLRNIAVTAPYMHDGRFATLRDVFAHYDHGIVDTPTLDPSFRFPNGTLRTPSISNEASIAALEAFLRTLTDNAVLTDPRWSDPFL